MKIIEKSETDIVVTSDDVFYLLGQFEKQT